MGLSIQLSPKLSIPANDLDDMKITRITTLGGGWCDDENSTLPLDVFHPNFSNFLSRLDHRFWGSPFLEIELELYSTVLSAESLFHLELKVKSPVKDQTRCLFYEFSQDQSINLRKLRRELASPLYRYQKGQFVDYVDRDLRHRQMMCVLHLMMDDAGLKLNSSFTLPLQTELVFPEHKFIFSVDSSPHRSTGVSSEIKNPQVKLKTISLNQKAW